MALDSEFNSILDFQYQPNVSHFGWDIDLPVGSIDASCTSYFDDAFAFNALDDGFLQDEWQDLDSSGELSCFEHIQPCLPMSSLLESRLETSIQISQGIDGIDTSGGAPFTAFSSRASHVSNQDQPQSNTPILERQESSQAQNFENMVSTFQGMPNDPEAKRRRSSYQADRRREVALMRKVKSCTRCRKQKVSCKFPGPCDRCKEAAGSASLARHICLRQPLKDLRYGSFDLLFQSFNEEWLAEQVGQCYGPKWEVECHLFHNESIASTKPLLMTLQSYSTPKSETGSYQITAIDGFDSSGAIINQIEVYRVAIAAETLPTIEDILEWVKIESFSTALDPTYRLIDSLAHFMATYCSSQPQLPLHNLINESVKILKLLRCWRGFVKLYDITPKRGKSVNYDSIVSNAASSQILIVLKKGICDSEMSILETLETLLYRSTGPGQRNSVPLWACLWTLILTYRDCMATYKLYSASPSAPTGLHSTLLIGASQHMYDILTSIYAALFRSSTPLYLDWRLEENFSLFGKSEKLRDVFCNMCTDVFWFYLTRDTLGPEDRLLKTIVIEHEMELRPRYPSTAAGLSKSRPILISRHQIVK